MANAFWGVTGFFIVLEIAFAMAVLFSGGTKDDKQWVPPLHCSSLVNSTIPMLFSQALCSTLSEPILTRQRSAG